MKPSNITGNIQRPEDTVEYFVSIQRNLSTIKYDITKSY